MTCSTCGTEIQAGETSCSLCGAALTPAGPGVAVPRPPAPDRTTIVSPATGAVPVARAMSATGTSPPGASPAGVSSADQVAARPRTPRTPFVDDEIQGLLRQGYVHLRRKNLPAAREAADRVLALDADDPLGHELLGLLLEEDGDEMAALREYRLACATEPKPPDAELRMAHILLSLPPELIARVQPPRVSASDDLPPEVAARISPVFRAQLEAVRPTPPRKTRATLPAFASLAIPGCGQYLKGHYGKAVAMFVVWLGCVLMLSTLMPQRWSNHTSVPLTDPMLWIIAFVMLIDYIFSIGDAAAPPDRFGP
ncbi:MAG: hypothetical protein LC772_00545 [Chloroflexi bacterium]|nr:hypothetical protein [Chloroflexota bacterium]